MTDSATDTSVASTSTAAPEVAAPAAPTPTSASDATTTQPTTGAAATATTPNGSQTSADRSPTTDTRNNAQPNAQQRQGQQPATATRTAPVADSYEKRFNDQQQYLNRLQREVAEGKKYRESWGDLNPQQVREMVSRQQSEAQRNQLKPWNPQHPEYAQNAPRLDRVKSFSAARERILARPDLQPEQKSALIGDLADASGVTNADVQLFRDYQQYKADFSERFTRDPESAIADIVERRVQARLQQYDQYRQVSTATEQWMTNPQNAPLLEKHAEDVLWAMNDQTPRREVGITIAKLKAENEALKARVGSQREVVETAAAQQAATRKRSTVIRDAVTQPNSTDPVAEGQQQGLQGSDLLNFLRSKRRAE